MNRDQYGRAYENGCKRTMNFLLSKGLPQEEAAETAHAAWAKGWERRHQLRDPSKTLVWVNSIAINMYRTGLRREINLQEFEEAPVSPPPTSVAIDVQRMLRRCAHGDRRILEQRYLEDSEISDLAKEHRASETAIRVRLMRARRSLRRQFERVPIRAFLPNRSADRN